MEATAPVDLLRRAGAEVTVATVNDELVTEGRNQLRWEADALLKDAATESYDVIIVPGGPGHKVLRNNQQVLHLLRGQAEADRLIGAICAAPLVLHEAGLLDGKRYTAHFSAAEELKEIRRDDAVVVDGKLITSQGAGTATRFGLALISALYGEEKANEVAASICHLSDRAAQ
ncbi:MAG: 4-methyl-5(b-hydroxyethyl)-thiazole monophosphate biosynthesi [Puniceicoccaceae bacterium 5H]|nr:MAG: 4-methyl-5(b-hydroxyethyl)-thiazole monophosphate biosynthesi [Puniceicoccaceae bacterium 5H]